MSEEFEDFEIEDEFFEDADWDDEESSENDYYEERNSEYDGMTPLLELNIVSASGACSAVLVFGLGETGLANDHSNEKFTDKEHFLRQLAKRARLAQKHNKFGIVRYTPEGPVNRPFEDMSVLVASTNTEQVIIGDIFRELGFTSVGPTYCTKNGVYVLFWSIPIADLLKAAEEAGVARSEFHYVG